MSIGPVDTFLPAKSAEAAYASVGTGQAEARPESGAAEEASQPVSGTTPKQKSSVAQKAPVAYELPQDVVEMHQDSEIKDQIIIREETHGNQL